jgi:hypothetical protein
MEASERRGACWRKKIKAKPSEGVAMVANFLSRAGVVVERERSSDWTGTGEGGRESE